ncbi:GIY-YIG nuclease family protein [Hydrogenoanaerobacterium saccharovorans]|nr:GIY-YIG nuclease family protein [Hydrogenoanaerobacterium saccharovorans]
MIKNDKIKGYLMDKKNNCVYILLCSDGTLYTGWTNDLEKRIKAHNAGKGAKYTKAHLPVELVYSEEYTTKSEAMKREYAIKQLTKAQKLELIENIGKKYAQVVEA